VNSNNKDELNSNYKDELNPGILRKIFFFFGLVFAQISNFVFWLEEAIPFEEFLIFDLFLIFSLFYVIFKEYGIVNNNSIMANYTCLLGAVNNFIATSFFLLWGIFFPEKDMAFVKKIGINGNFQIAFDLISLLALSFIFIKYKNKIAGLTNDKIILSEVILIIALASTLLLF